MEQPTHVILRGEPFTGKSTLAQCLAYVANGAIHAVSKDDVAQRLGMNRQNTAYTPDIRARLYAAFLQEVSDALQNLHYRVVISEAPFSTQTDITAFIGGITHPARHTVITLYTSQERRAHFIQLGRRDKDLQPRGLVGFEQAVGDAGNFEPDIRIPGIMHERVLVGELDETVQRVYKLLINP